MAGKRFNNVGIPEGWDGDGAAPKDFNQSFVIIKSYQDNVDFSDVEQVWLTEAQTVKQLLPTVGDESVQSSYAIYGEGGYGEMVNVIQQPDGSVRLRFTTGLYSDDYLSSMRSFWPILRDGSPADFANHYAVMLQERYGSSNVVLTLNQVGAINVGDSGDIQLNRKLVDARATKEKYLQVLKDVLGSLPFSQIK